METKRYKTYAKNRSPRLKNFDYSTNRPYFITICTKEGTPFLKGVFASKAIRCLEHSRAKYCFKVYAYCVMPDHMRLLLAPGVSKLSLSKIVQGFKSITARLHNSNGGQGKLWQRYFYDHILRKEEDLRNVALYVLENPVRKGLVTNWKDYPYCGMIDKIE